MIDLSILAAPLALLSIAAPPPPDPSDPPPPFNTTPPSRALIERAVTRWEHWYWKAPDTGATIGRIATTCGPTKPGSNQRRCFSTYLATPTDETPVQIIDWFRNCRVTRGAGNSLTEAPPASGLLPTAKIGLGKNRQLTCTFTGYAVDPA